MERSFRDLINAKMAFKITLLTKDSFDYTASFEVESLARSLKVNTMEVKLKSGNFPLPNDKFEQVHTRTLSCQRFTEKQRSSSSSRQRSIEKQNSSPKESNQRERPTSHRSELQSLAEKLQSLVKEVPHPVSILPSAPKLRRQVHNNSRMQVPLFDETASDQEHISNWRKQDVLPADFAAILARRGGSMKMDSSKVRGYHHRCQRSNHPAPNTAPIQNQVLFSECGVSIQVSEIRSAFETGLPKSSLQRMSSSRSRSNVSSESIALTTGPVQFGSTNGDLMNSHKFSDVRTAFESGAAFVRDFPVWDPFAVRRLRRIGPSSTALDTYDRLIVERQSQHQLR